MEDLPESTNVIEDKAATLPELYDRLDSLWIAYLNHLDHYTAAQKALQKHMSAGFLSLARANFNARKGVRRYGKDFYHERAIASRRADISAETGDSDTQLKVVEWRPSDEDETAVIDDVDQKREEAIHEDPKQQPSPPATPSSEGDETRSDDLQESAPEPPVPSNVGIQDSESNDRKPALTLDPIRWFGILVPQELRSAQASFVAAVQDPAVDAVNAARQMRETEVNIRRLRKDIKKAEKSSA